MPSHMTSAPERVRIAELRARTRVSDVVRSHVALKRRGRLLWGLCPFHSENTPSFSVDDDRGRWRCWGCQAHGDALDFLQRAEGLAVKAAVAALARMAGLPEPNRHAQRLPGRDDRPRPAAPPHREHDDARGRRAAALAIWRGARPIDGTPAELYLRARGITAPLPPSLRFAAELKHGPSGRILPALVAAVCDVRGKITGVWRIWVERDAKGVWRKSSASPAKMGLGTTAGCAVRLSRLSPRVAVTEGIETGLAVLSACPEMTIWAALSTAGMVGLELPPVVGDALICADNDEPGRAAAGEAALRLRAVGKRVLVAVPPQAGFDFNDLLMEACA